MTKFIETTERDGTRSTGSVVVRPDREDPDRATVRSHGADGRLLGEKELTAEEALTFCAGLVERGFTARRDGSGGLVLEPPL